MANNFSSQADLEVIDHDVESHERHTANPIQVANRQVDHNLRTLATTTTTQTRDVVNEAAAEFPTDEALLILKDRKQKNDSRTVQRIRKRNRNEPEIPTTAFFDIPDEMSKLKNGENFVLADWSETIGGQQERILILGNSILNC